jgi:hypothetical protein
MAKSTPSWAAWFLKATMLPPVDWDWRLEGRDGLAQPHQADLGPA